MTNVSLKLPRYAMRGLVYCIRIKARLESGFRPFPAAKSSTTRLAIAPLLSRSSTKLYPRHLTLIGF